MNLFSLKKQVTKNDWFRLYREDGDLPVQRNGKSCYWDPGGLCCLNYFGWEHQAFLSGGCTQQRIRCANVGGESY